MFFQKEAVGNFFKRHLVWTLWRETVSGVGQVASWPDVERTWVKKRLNYCSATVQPRSQGAAEAGEHSTGGRFLRFFCCVYNLKSFSELQHVIPGDS